MMIFDQNRQSATKHNHSYAAKKFARFWTKRAVFKPGIILFGILRKES